MEDYEKKYKKLVSKIEKAYLYAQTDSTKAVLEEIRPELKESEGERICEQIISFIEEYGNPIHCEWQKDWIAWLEKQGKQKTIDMSIKEKAHQIAWETSKHYDPLLSKESWCEMAALDMASWLEKQGEQKPIIDGILTATNYDKIFQNCNVHKFKVGDWIVNNDTKDVFLIKSFNNGYCTLEDIKGNIISPCLPPYESESHLWSIQDAKEGDVLYNAEYNNILIYKHQNGSKDFVSSCRLGLNTYTFYSCEDFEWGDVIWHPATKEQRDLLFSKMHEAGYEWDEKKKLLSELKESEDEIRKGIIKFLIDVNNDSYTKSELDIASWIAWLEKQSEKTVWTDNDKTMVSTLMRDVEQINYINQEGKNKRLEWLNSLEDRFNKGKL